MNRIDFENILRDMGYKLTIPRRIVFEVLNNTYDRHLNASDVLDLAKGYKENIGTATVYRALSLYKRLGLVYEIDFDDGFSRYEIRKQIDGHRHHHLICESCGAVTELKDDLLEKLESEIEKTKGFVVKDHRVKIYGICEKCRANAN